MKGNQRIISFNKYLTDCYYQTFNKVWFFFLYYSLPWIDCLFLSLDFGKSCFHNLLSFSLVLILVVASQISSRSHDLLFHAILFDRGFKITKVWFVINATVTPDVELVSRIHPSSWQVVYVLSYWLFSYNDLHIPCLVELWRF